MSAKTEVWGVFLSKEKTEEPFGRKLGFQWDCTQTCKCYACLLLY